MNGYDKKSILQMNIEDLNNKIKRAETDKAIAIKELKDVISEVEG